MTVMILAQEGDITADQVVMSLSTRNVPIARVDLSWFPAQLCVHAELHYGKWAGWLRTEHHAVDLGSISAIWYRNPSTFAFPDALSATERQWAHTEAKLGLGGVLVSLDTLWVNHPSRHADAVYKPRQLALAARCGLAVPTTAVTNDPDAARTFCGTASEPAVTKAFGAVSITGEGGRKVAMTQRLSGADLSDLCGVEITAHQFQDWVPKAHDARVIAIGDAMFTVAIYAGSAASWLDWRTDYASLRYELMNPPEIVASGVRALMQELGLHYGALDFVVTPDGEWLFLEINPGGQYGWLEAETGAPMTAALVDLLAGEEP